MIYRLWHGWTTLANADTYEALLQKEIFVGIKQRNLPGFVDIQLLRRCIGPEVEFVTIMRFESIRAVRDFAGQNYEIAVVPAKARELLSHYDEISQHYETRGPDEEEAVNW